MIARPSSSHDLALHICVLYCTYTIRYLWMSSQQAINQGGCLCLRHGARVSKCLLLYIDSCPVSASIPLMVLIARLCLCFSCACCTPWRVLHLVILSSSKDSYSSPLKRRCCCRAILAWDCRTFHRGDSFMRYGSFHSGIYLPQRHLSSAFSFRSP